MSFLFFFSVDNFLQETGLNRGEEKYPCTKLQCESFPCAFLMRTLGIEIIWCAELKCAHYGNKRNSDSATIPKLCPLAETNRLCFSL